MPWVRVDDAFYDHPKWIEAGPLAGWLGMCALAWCNRNQTDGFIPNGKVQLLADFTMHAEIDEKEDPNELRVEAWRVSPYVLADQLVKIGLWERAAGGFLVHNYLRFQKSAQEIREIAFKRAESGRKGGLSKPTASGEAGSEEDTSKPEANPEAQSQSQVVLTEPPLAVVPDAPKRRAERIPDEWIVTPEMEAWALGKCPDIDWRNQTERFVNHWKAKSGKDATKLDWERTWRNWLLQAQDWVKNKSAVRTHL